MFEKIFGSLFVKTAKKSNITVISAKREIKALKSVSTKPESVKNQAFWDNRGKAYGALFTSLNGRIF
ncbi:MAG: hypothetical protein J6Y43_02725 [Clostridia bacterium]|nr:hypothetical protein [Clostridia bacterium]